MQLIQKSQRKRTQELSPKTETMTSEQIHSAINSGLATRQPTLFAGSPENGAVMINGSILKGIVVEQPLS